MLRLGMAMTAVLLLVLAAACSGRDGVGSRKAEKQVPQTATQEVEAGPVVAERHEAELPASCTMDPSAVVASWFKAVEQNNDAAVQRLLAVPFHGEWPLNMREWHARCSVDDEWIFRVTTLEGSEHQSVVQCLLKDRAFAQELGYVGRVPYVQFRLDRVEEIARSATLEKFNVQAHKPDDVLFRYLLEDGGSESKGLVGVRCNQVFAFVRRYEFQD